MKMQRIIDTSRRPAEGFAHLRRGMSRRMERSGPDRTRDQIEMMPVCNAYDHPDAGNVYQQRQWRATAPAYLPRGRYITQPTICFLDVHIWDTIELKTQHY